MNTESKNYVRTFIGYLFPLEMLVRIGRVITIAVSHGKMKRNKKKHLECLTASFKNEKKKCEEITTCLQMYTIEHKPICTKTQGIEEANET